VHIGNTPVTEVEVSKDKNHKTTMTYVRKAPAVGARTTVTQAEHFMLISYDTLAAPVVQFEALESEAGMHTGPWFDLAVKMNVRPRYEIMVGICSRKGQEKVVQCKKIEGNCLKTSHDPECCLP